MHPLQAPDSSKGDTEVFDDDTREVFHRYPKGNVQRAVYEDQVKWNGTHGDAKGFRFHPQTLRLACYVQGISGSSAYNILHDVLHLPSPTRIARLRREAAPVKAGLQEENIKKYGKIAALEGADIADLTGMAVWNLMHLSKNGFKFSPNGDEITGLVDPELFFNPACAPDPAGGGGDLDKALTDVVATQCVECFFVSAANPRYKFVVFREAARALNKDYIMRMLVTVLRALAGAHEDKGFDVIATVCDGSAEHRSFQVHAATETFGKWAREGEGAFSNFMVAFLHPVHGGPVFSMSDFVHAMKKIVNALWHSDIDKKGRSLGMHRTNPKTGEKEFNLFSIKTAESVYNRAESLGGESTLEDRAATLRIFQHLTPAMFRKTHHTCMNISLSAKTVSGTIISAIRSYQEPLPEPDGPLENYETLACNMNDFMDIMNGCYTRSKFERRQGLHQKKGFITTSDSAHLTRLMEILGFFLQWKEELEASPPIDANWERHFITRESWFDLRVCILGFVSTCRYLLELPETYGVDRASPRETATSILAPSARNIVEHRFAHIRQGLGTHRNPTKEQAYSQSTIGDVNRGLNGVSRRNASHTLGRGSK